MYSQSLAGLSNFIDTSLSVDMKEKASREIVLQDVEPDLFEKALKFQQDFSSIRSMTTQDALEVLPFYDKFEFFGGLELCDKVFCECIEQHNTGGKELLGPDKLDLLVQAMAMAHNYNLPKSAQKGIEYGASQFQPDHPFGSENFTKEHIRMLQPILNEHIDLPPGIEKEDLESTLFPKFFLSQKTSSFAVKQIKSCYLEGTAYAGFVTGNFVLKGDHFKAVDEKGAVRTSQMDLRSSLSGELERFSGFLRIKKAPNHGKDWTIQFVYEKGGLTRPSTLWKCVASSGLEYPPTGPWTTVFKFDNLDKETMAPRIRYD